LAGCAASRHCGGPRQPRRRFDGYEHADGDSQRAQAAQERLLPITGSRTVALHGVTRTLASMQNECVHEGGERFRSGRPAAVRNRASSAPASPTGAGEPTGAPRSRRSSRSGRRRAHPGAPHTAARRTAEPGADVAERREREQRDDHVGAGPRPCRRRRDGQQRQQRTRRERQRRCPRGLERPGKPLGIEAQLVAGVHLQRIAARHGLRDLARQSGRQTALLVDPRELAQLAARVAAKLALLQADVGPLGVALRADQHILPGGHGQRPRPPPRQIPALTITTPDEPDAATPGTRIAVDRMPSFAPSTAARRQLDRRLRCSRESEIEARRDGPYSRPSGGRTVCPRTCFGA
jgi:hypothetical protein